MKTIKNDIRNEYIIKKSKFITYLFYIENEDEAKEKLNNVREEYKDATHCCFGYVVDNVTRYGDDGEPGGTAGMPIINVLINNELNHVLAIVIRYFGGIKLGAGGLVRAYTNSVVEALDNTSIVELKEGYIACLTFMHDNIKYVDNILKKYNLDIKKEYNEKIIYSFSISLDDYDLLNNELNDEVNLSIEKNALIK